MKSVPFLTKYEKTYILSMRSLMISKGSPICINIDHIKNPTPYEIAEIEFKRNKIPLKLIREHPNGDVEIIDISKLYKI